MLWSKICLCLCSLMLVAGCASTDQAVENIPYPRSTPFDSREPERQAFMDGFRTGYRSEIHGNRDTADNLPSPYLQARKLGFHAGQGAARAEKSESRKSP